MSAPPTMPSDSLRAPELAGLAWTAGTPADAGRAARLAEQAFDPEYRESWTEGQIAGLLGGSAGWLDLGWQQARLVAFALCRQTLDEVELLLCAVAPDMRGRGVGRRMMQQVLDGARARGARRLFLEVRSSNTAALALYRATGFAAAGRRPGYYRTLSGHSIDALTLGLILTGRT